MQHTGGMGGRMGPGAGWTVVLRRRAGAADGLEHDRWNMVLPGFPDRCLGAETPDRSASSLLSPGEQAEELGLYQDEEEELEFKVDYEDGSQLILSVGYEEKPGQFHRLNSYGIDRKKGTAEPVIGKEIISLW